MPKKESGTKVHELLEQIGKFLQEAPSARGDQVKGKEQAQEALTSLRNLFSAVNASTFACTEIRPLEKAGLVTMQLACTEVRPIEKMGVIDSSSAYVGVRSAGSLGEEMSIELKCTEIRPLEKSASATLPLACTEIRPLEKTVSLLDSHLTCDTQLPRLKTQYEATVELACTEVRPLEKTAEVTAVIKTD